MNSTEMQATNQETSAISALDINEAAEIYRNTRRQDPEKVADDEPIAENLIPVAEPSEKTAKDATPEEEPKDRLSKSWAAISKKEAFIRKALAEIKETKSQLELSTKEIDELRQLKRALQEDPVKVLDNVAGKDWYEKATQRFLQDSSGKLSAEEKIQHLEKKIELEREEREKWFKSRWDEEEKKYRQQAEYQSKANEYVNELTKVISAGDDFELTRSTDGGVEAVLEVVNGYLQKTGKLLSPTEAATLVEKELELEAEKLLKSQKLRQKLSTFSQPTKKSSGGSMKSISNDMTMATPQTLSRGEELEEAANLYRRVRNATSA